MNRTILNKALKTLKDRKTSAERIADANYKVALENKDFDNLRALLDEGRRIKEEVDGT